MAYAGKKIINISIFKTTEEFLNQIFRELLLRHKNLISQFNN